MPIKSESSVPKEEECETSVLKKDKEEEEEGEEKQGEEEGKEEVYFTF